MILYRILFLVLTERLIISHSFLNRILTRSGLCYCTLT